MLLLTIIFITSSLYFLRTGVNSAITQSTILLYEEQIKHLDDPVYKMEKSEHFKKVVFSVLLIIILFVLECIYIVNALYIDTYKIPTICMLVLMLLNFTRAKKSSQETDHVSNLEQIRENIASLKKRSFRGFSIQLLSLLYYTYMFYILVF